MEHPTPFNGMRFAHKAIRNEAEGMEKAARELGSTDDGQAAKLADRFAFFRAVMDGHWAGEEKVLWPALEAKVTGVTVPYTLDHQLEQDVFRAIEDLLSAYRGAQTAEERIELARRANREFVALNTAITNHSRKEDVHIIPLVEEQFDIAQQETLSGGMVAYLPKEAMGRITQMVMVALTTDEREAYLRLLLAKMPPAALPGTAQAVKAALSAADWAALTARLPELQAAAS